MTKNWMFAALAVSLVTGACVRSSSTDSVDSAGAAVDSQEAVSDEGDVMIATIDGADAGATPTVAVTATQASATIAANVASRWTGNCAVATQSGADVTVTLTDCTGPRGLVHVTGELDLTIAIAPSGAITVHATATDLEVNGATLDFTADGTYTESGSMRQLVVTAEGSGTGARGNAIDHDGNYTLQWDTTDECRSIDGEWSTELSTPVASATRANDVDISRCGASCPTGTLTHTYIGGATLTITYDGTATAAWATSGGLKGTVGLFCTP